MKLYTFLYILTLLVASSCYDDIDLTTEEEFPEPPEVIITTKLVGSVSDGNGIAINDYTLDWGTEITEAEGKNYLADLTEINKIDQTIFVRKGGDVISLMHYPLVENDVNRKDFTSFSPSSTITLDNAFALSQRLEISQSLATTTSNIQLKHKIIENADNQISHGYDNASQMQKLSNVSIHHIDFDETEITIEKHLNANVGSGAKLYSLSDSGKWQEHEIADNSYKIYRSGYYLVANAVPGVIANGKIQKDGKAISYIPYSVLSSLQLSTENGNWIGVVEKESTTNIDVQNPCQEVIHQQSITSDASPLTADIEIDSNLDIFNLKSTILDCDGEPKDNVTSLEVGTDGNATEYLFPNGTLDLNIPVCDAQFDVTTIISETNTKGLSLPWSTTIEDDISYLIACEDYKQGYSYFKIRDFVKLYPPFTIAVEGDNYIFQSLDENYRILIKQDGRGSYPTEEVNIKLYDPTFGDKGYAISCENSHVGCGIDDCYISHVGEDEDWYRVSLSGDVWMQTLSPLSASTFSLEAVLLIKKD